MLLLPFGVFCLQNLLFAFSQDTQLHVCNDVIKPPTNRDFQENCTLLCGLYIRHFVLPHGPQEVALCSKDEFTPLLCNRNGDCHQHHRGSYCKKIHCLCDEDDRHHTFLPRPPVDFLDICVVPSNWLHPNMPLVAFPWKTVLAVFGSLGLVVVIFMGFRWLYPLMRTFRGRDGRNRANNECCPSSDGNIASPLYPDIPQTRLCNRSIPHGDPDKPPSYENLVRLLDLPPSYEETGCLPSSPNLLDEENQNQRRVTNSAPAQQPKESETEVSTQLQNNK